MDDKWRDLDRLTGIIEAHQKNLGLSDTQFGQRFSFYVGSPKTWTAFLRARDWKARPAKTDKWLGKLRQFTNEIQGGTQDVEPIDSLPIVKRALRLYEELQDQREDRRCAMLPGIQGTGKTFALRRVCARHVKDTAFLSANETWKDSRWQIASAVAGAVNAPVVSSASRTFTGAIAALKANPITLIIDEAHEGGVLLMKLVKTIINETRAKVMLGLYPTSWRRLNNGANDAYAEAQQLLRRTLRPVAADWLGGISEKDVNAWFAGSGLDGYRTITKNILADVRTQGNFSLLADAKRRMEFIADERDAEETPRLFVEMIDELCGKPIAAHKEEEAA